MMTRLDQMLAAKVKRQEEGAKKQNKERREGKSEKKAARRSGADLVGIRRA